MSFCDICEHGEPLSCPPGIVCPRHQKEFKDGKELHLKEDRFWYETRYSSMSYVPRGSFISPNSIKSEIKLINDAMFKRRKFNLKWYGSCDDLTVSSMDAATETLTKCLKVGGMICYECVKSKERFECPGGILRYAKDGVPYHPFGLV